MKTSRERKVEVEAAESAGAVLCHTVSLEWLTYHGTWKTSMDGQKRTQEQHLFVMA